MPIFDKTWTHDPNAVSDYTRNWSRWLATGDTISASTWILTGGLVIDAESFDDQSATVWVSAGAAGDVAYATNRITTVGGRTQDRTFRLIVRER